MVKNKALGCKAVAVIAALLAILGLGYCINKNMAAVAVVTFESDIAVQVSVNSWLRVIDIAVSGDETEAALEEIQIIGNDIEAAAQKLVDVMLQQGYLTHDKNSLLISVQSGSEQVTKQLLAQSDDAVSKAFDEHGFNGLLIKQVVVENESITEMAQRCNITEGKAQLVQLLMMHNAFYSEQQLVELSLHDICLLAEYAGEIDALSMKGKASENAYIGKEAAIDAALQHAQLSYDEVKEPYAELYFDDGLMVYKVTFSARSFKGLALFGADFDYRVRATDGLVWDYDYSHWSGGATIGEEAARDAALQHAGVDAAAISDYSCRREQEHDIAVYTIAFEAGGYEYEYFINAYDGAVMRHRKKSS